MEWTGNLIYDKENRQEKMNAVLAELMPPIYKKRKEDAWTHYREHQEKTGRAFYEAVRDGLEQKPEARFLCCSYLLSGALTGEMLLKLDCYDERRYADTKEAGGYWDYRELFAHVEEDIGEVRNQFRRSVLRVKEYEVDDFRLFDQTAGFMILLGIVEDLVKEENRRVYMPHFRSFPVSVFFGPYLGQAQRLIVWEEGDV